ncbi:SPOR domain-containing protein [Oceanospirillaceae bacterium]|nr:SPOR domain-containing protein [Oceanospirillaceae bacterium]
MCAIFLTGLVNGAVPISQNSTLKVNQERIILHDLVSEFVDHFFVCEYAHFGGAKKTVPDFTEQSDSFLQYSLSIEINESCNKGAFNSSLPATEIRTFVKKIDRDLLVFYGGVNANNVLKVSRFYRLLSDGEVVPVTDFYVHTNEDIEKQSVITLFELKNTKGVGLADVPEVNEPKLRPVIVKAGSLAPSDTPRLSILEPTLGSTIEAKAIIFPDIVKVTMPAVPQPQQTHEAMSALVTLSLPSVFWQVQVMATLDEANLIAAKNTLSKSGIKSVLDFEAPFYKLRVGPYITKKATWAAQKELRARFAGAFAVKVDPSDP